jgi:hypothetical protein
MKDPIHLEHSDLMECGERLIEVLAGLGTRLMPADDVAHGQHYDFSERALGLSISLRSVVASLALYLYPGCYALLRVALEHQLMDRLLFLGDRYKRRWSGVPRAKAEETKAAWTSGQDGTQDILEVDWIEHRNQVDVGELTVVRSGVHETGKVKTGNPTLSYFYVLLFLQHYDPFAPHSRDEGVMEHPFTDEEALDRWAAENRATYRQTRWSSLKENLLLNELATEEDFTKLGVHYRFLSAFVHPYPRGYDEVYGRNRPSGAPRYDHFNSELCLLYLARVASEEILDFKRMTEREPSVDIEGWHEIESWVVRAQSLTDYLWFPGSGPHAFDRFQEANARSFAARLAGEDPLNPKPEVIDADEVRYYSHPLRRLRALHRSAVEGTNGFYYQSPWPRADAGF